MIRHELTSCVACHADPSGGGLLTPYGRVQSEELLRTRYGHVAPDDDTHLGDFLFGAVMLPEGLIAGGDVRAAWINVKPSGAAPQSRLFLMQSDAAAQYESGRLRVNASLGYQHEGALAASITHGTYDRLVSRRHWVGIDLGDDRAWLLRAGRIDVPFGLRMIEHTSLVRTATRTRIDADQEHGVALAYSGEKWRGEVMVIAGNLQVSPDDARRRGYSGYVEYAARKNLAAGFSSLITESDIDLEQLQPTFRQAHGLFVRWSPVRLVVLSAEADLLVRSPRRSVIDMGFATWAQADLELARGVHFGGAFEAKEEALARDSATLGAWGSMWWFFAPHADVRLDAIWQSIPTGGTRMAATSLLAQVHAFF